MHHKNANNGGVAFSAGLPERDAGGTIQTVCRGGTARLESLTVFEMRSAWRRE